MRHELKIKSYREKKRKLVYKGVSFHMLLYTFLLRLGQISQQALMSATKTISLAFL